MLLKIFSQVIFFFSLVIIAASGTENPRKKFVTFAVKCIIQGDTPQIRFFLLLVFYKLKKSRGQKPFKTSALAQNGRSVIGRKFYDAHHSQISLCKRWRVCVYAILYINYTYMKIEKPWNHQQKKKKKQLHNVWKSPKMSHLNLQRAEMA